MIDKQTIDRIMDATQIVDVVGEFVSLKKRGANHIGCCPFHNEKTPSFYVSPSKGIYKCFGCGESGNAVGFLMKHEHYSYPEALKWLAAKYNIPVEEEPLNEEELKKQNERDNLFHVSEFAQKYFADLLTNDELGRAIGLAYFHQRGLSDEIIKRFGLGYCKDEWTDFTDHALRNGYSLDVLQKTGLTIVKESEAGETGQKIRRYDRFRGRVMFPIFSISGRVIGFSGRVLSKEKQAAKYVNSPESEIYDKSNALYGIYQARSAIGRADMCYLVEGNVDVLSMHQSGVENTVASCGTSLTAPQIRIIKRYTNNVTVLYDGDAAGIKATLKAVNLLFSEGMHVRTVLFPDGEDPDSYAQKYGSEQLQRYLAEHSENFLMYRARLVGDEIQRDPMRKTEYVNEIVHSLALISNQQERTEYVRQCAYLFKTPEDLLSNMVARSIGDAHRKLLQEQQREAAREAANDPAIQQQAQAVAASGTPRVNTNSIQPETYGFVPPPDDLFLPSNEYTSPPQVLPSLNPAEAQEANVARLLIRHGSTVIEIESKNDDDNEEKEEGDETPETRKTYKVVVAELIVDDITNDDITIDNPLYKKIFDIYKDCVQNGKKLPDANYFAMQQDNQLRNYALTQMMEPYQISPLWEERGISLDVVEHPIGIDDEEEISKIRQEIDQNRRLKRLSIEVQETLCALKVMKLDTIIAELRRQLNETKDEDKMIEMLQEVAAYQEIKHKIEKQLHRVISI
ncbi:MAG: DNA primase [Bacteroidales bacterium]|nr:DNA primase [Bacteroidales bacterium]